MNRSLVFDLATGAFINKREDALFLGPDGTAKSHLAQAFGQCAIQQGYKVLYRETHILLDELADSVTDGRRKEYMESMSTEGRVRGEDSNRKPSELPSSEGSH